MGIWLVRKKGERISYRLIWKNVIFISWVREWGVRKVIEVLLFLNNF